jgi:hypothetical protein
VIGTELGHQFCRVLGGIDSQGLWNDEQSICKLGNSKLFTGSLI